MLKAARERGVKTLRSLHRFDPADPGDITRLLAELSLSAGDGIKLAVRVEDAARLEEFFTAPKDRPAVLIGMGPAGILSRWLPDRFGGAFTYVSARPWPDETMGLFDLETARARGLPLPDDAPLFVLLGDGSISGSPGPAVYNALFRAAGFPGLYLPVVTLDPESAFTLLLRLGLRGASVTIPHKLKVLELASRRDRFAEGIETANTLFLDDEGRWTAANTDVPAVQYLARTLGALPGQNAVVIGTGGFARACAAALADMGLWVTLLGRTLLLDGGPWIASFPLKALDGMEFDVLVHATPPWAGTAYRASFPKRCPSRGGSSSTGYCRRSPRRS